MDAHDALTELNFILRIFSLHDIYRGQKLNISRSYLKMAFILLCSGFALGYNFYYHFFTKTPFKLNPTIQIMDHVGILCGFLLYIIDIYYVHTYKYVGESFTMYLKTYSEMDMYFEMKYHDEIRKKVRCSIVLFILLWFLPSVTDYAAWSLYFDWHAPTAYTVTYFTFSIQILTVLELNSHTMLIRYRLKTMVKVLEDHFALAQDTPTRIKVITKWSQVLIKNKAKIVPLKIREPLEIARLSSYYLLLSQQASFLNNFFGVRILLYCLYTLTEMTAFVNKIVRVILGSMNMTINIGWYPAVTTFLRLATCATLLWSLAYRCEQSAQQLGRLISAMDHVIVNKRINMEDRSSLQQLRNLVSSRPIRFHAANFFTLDLSLILSTASVVVTYAVLLIQTAVS